MYVYVYEHGIIKLIKLWTNTCVFSHSIVEGGRGDYHATFLLHCEGSIHEHQDYAHSKDSGGIVQ